MFHNFQSCATLLGEWMAFGLLTAGWSLGKVARGYQECHQQAQVREGEGQLGWGHGRYGGLGEEWEKEVVFTRAEQVVERKSEGEPLTVSCPVEIGLICSKMCCNISRIYIVLEEFFFVFLLIQLGAFLHFLQGLPIKTPWLYEEQLLVNRLITMKSQPNCFELDSDVVLLNFDQK